MKSEFRHETRHYHYYYNPFTFHLFLFRFFFFIILVRCEASSNAQCMHEIWTEHSFWWVNKKERTEERFPLFRAASHHLAICVALKATPQIVVAVPPWDNVNNSWDQLYVINMECILYSPRRISNKKQLISYSISILLTSGIFSWR